MSFKEIRFAPVSSNDNTIVIAAGGDILIKNNISKVVIDNSPDYLFSELRSNLSNAHIVFANLETPITSKEKKNVEKDSTLPFLKIVPEIAEAFPKAPIHIFGLANNHILDYGDEGLRDTIKTLEHLGISYVGAGMNLEEARKLIIIEAKGKRIGFLAYSNNYYARKGKPGCAPIQKEIIIKDLERYRHTCDYLLVSLHHGIVYSNYPLPEHMVLARKIIDNGADIVICHHPHVIQGMEVYGGGLIMYSLGSLIYDLTEDEDKVELQNCTIYKECAFQYNNDTRLREGILMMLGIQNDRLSVETLPVVQDNLNIPRIAKYKRSEKVLSRLHKISNDLSNPELLEWRILKKLSSIENIYGLYDTGIWTVLKRIHRIRWKHFDYILRYLLSKFI